MLAELNYVAILVAMLIAFILGWLWYGPIFGKPWMKLTSRSESDPKESMVGPITMGLITTFIMSLTTAWLVTALGVVDLIGAIKVALIIGVGFVGMYAFNDVNYEKAPFTLYLIKIRYMKSHCLAFY